MKHLKKEIKILLKQFLKSLLKKSNRGPISMFLELTVMVPNLHKTSYKLWISYFLCEMCCILKYRVTHKGCDLNNDVRALFAHIMCKQQFTDCIYSLVIKGWCQKWKKIFLVVAEVAFFVDNFVFERKI